ncbi:MAG TPA: hypothetical protein VFL73_05190 [Solirubrobacteraceae bacterium]|nr:hypothetical protein [Solirubrobacteraceae bacterium]
MPSATLVEAHRQEVADVVAVAQADLFEQWLGLPLDDADAMKVAGAAAVTDIVETYGPMAAGAGADWYAETRAEAGTRGSFRPRLEVPVIARQIATNVGWSVGPLYGTPKPDLALARLSGITQRLVANADRATILTNARRDPAGVRWYRGASAKCCSFCATLAGRGAVYRSEATADFKAHNNCKCFPAVLFPGESHELPSYYRDFADEYATAAEAVEAAGGKRTQSAVLSKMRELYGRA